jgi:uncharacterized protein
MESYRPATERAQPRISGPLVLAAGVVLLLLFLAGGVDFTTERMWFESLGYNGVFLTSIYARLALFGGAAALFFALFVANVAVARRFAYQFDVRPVRRVNTGSWEELLAQIGSQVAQRGDYGRLITLGTMAAGALLALFMGLLAAGQWMIALQFWNRTPFGQTDPLFGQDIGFHLFVVPAIRALEGWLFMALLLLGLSALALYVVILTYELAVNLGQVPFRLSRGIKGHLLTLVACGFVLAAVNHLLDMFDLVRQTHGDRFTGAGYTAVHAQVPGHYAMAGAALLAAVLCLVSIRTPGFRPALAGAGIWGAALLVLGWAFPTSMQSVDVSPNELDREKAYIANNIQFTRRAFGIEEIEERDVAFEDAVTASAITSEQATINSVRLWDHRPLLETYGQIQSIRTYYRFDDVDLDRYTLEGQYRQVMIAARELDVSRLGGQAQSWVSRQLQYTHGYGVAMTRVNVVTPEGLPDLVVRDIPPTGPIPITRPEIYFGERTNHYVVVRTGTPEFDFPRGDEGVFTTYAGDAGISVGNLWNRFLFTVKFQDPNFLLNSSFLPGSQLLYRRNIHERAEQIAPFLRLDPDPYIVAADGGLYWVHDAYTTSNRYPYSTALVVERPTGQGTTVRQRVNYIRNSVKIVTSAYDGSMRFYLVDPRDPIAQTYARIYPDLFSPVDQAPPSIRAHFRYPEELFGFQAQMYRRYHVQDPRVFFLSEDEWAIPHEIFQDAKAVAVEPYYVIMRLPGETRPEFILMLPFAPRDRENMVGWLAARNDDAQYGRMQVFKYPKDKLIFGPLQLENRIDQDPVISSQFALWNQSGTKVIRGNMLVIPVGSSSLYVEPIYLQAVGGGLPELKRVVVATGNRIAMEPTLEEGLNRIFGAGTAVSASATPTTRVPGIVQTAAQVAREAQETFTRAQEALRAGDFARYGEENRRLQELISQLVQVTGQQP